ncbi:MAG TPA: class I SAM-dependent methyltransferase [Candidatus Thermoplasmatota archaeon]|nr:class I SAM-dependent methyltransferase [Candidatus Thermoplasmatota archaeon]
MATACSPWTPRDGEHVGREFPAVDFRLADIRSLRFEPGSFDAVTALYSLIFLPSKEFDAALADCHRWLAPGGVLFVVAQGGPPSEPGVAALFRVMPMDDLLARTRDAGFAIVESSAREPRAHERKFQKLRVVATRSTG